MNWLNQAESIWAKKRGEKSDKLNIYQRLDYSKGIIHQNVKYKYKVLYNTSGTNLTSYVFDNTKKLAIQINGDKINLSGFIAESTTYYFETNDIAEAYYLCTVLNSTVIDELIKPMQARGQFGERHIHKKPLELPIPKFDNNNKMHKRLSEFGKLATEKVQKDSPKMKKYKSLGKTRVEIRKILNKEYQEINLIVSKLLSSVKNKTIHEF